MEKNVIEFDGLKIGLKISGIRTGIATHKRSLNELPEKFPSIKDSLNKTELEVYRLIRQRGYKNNGDTRTQNKFIADIVKITTRHVCRILNKLSMLGFIARDYVRRRSSDGSWKTTRVIRDLIVYVQKGCRTLIGVLRHGARNVDRFLRSKNWRHFMDSNHPEHYNSMHEISPYNEEFDNESFMMVDLMNAGDPDAQKILGKARILDYQDLVERYTDIFYDRLFTLDLRNEATKENTQIILDRTQDEFEEAVVEFNKERSQRFKGGNDE